MTVLLTLSNKFFGQKTCFFLTLQIYLNPHFNIVGFAVQVKSYDVSCTELKSVSNFVTKYKISTNDRGYQCVSLRVLFTTKQFSATPDTTGAAWS